MLPHTHNITTEVLVEFAHKSSLLSAGEHSVLILLLISRSVVFTVNLTVHIVCDIELSVCM